VRHLLDLGVTGDRFDRIRAAEIVADGVPLERAELDGAHVAECSVDRRLGRLCPLVFYVALIAQSPSQEATAASNLFFENRKSKMFAPSI